MEEPVSFDAIRISEKHVPDRHSYELKIEFLAGNKVVKEQAHELASPMAFHHGNTLTINKLSGTWSAQ